MLVSQLPNDRDVVDRRVLVEGGSICVAGRVTRHTIGKRLPTLNAQGIARLESETLTVDALLVKAKSLVLGTHLQAVRCARMLLCADT